MSMAVDLRTFQYRTDFTASQPRMLDPWDNTPFALATPTPGHRAIERLCRANGHFSRLNSLVSGLEIDMSLADTTVVSGDLVWAVPLRVVQPLDCSHPGVMETEAPQPLSSRRQRAIEAIDQIRRLCDVSDERAADLMGVARGTLRSWRVWQPGAISRHDPSPFRSGERYLSACQVNGAGGSPGLAPGTAPRELPLALTS